MDNIQEFLADFLVECGENLEEFEENLLSLEKDPKDHKLLDSMFRMIHSIKGASGFMSFHNLESLTHKTENILDLLRQDKGELSQDLISTFLVVCDTVKNLFGKIQESGTDGEDKPEGLINTLLEYEKQFNGEDSPKNKKKSTNRKSNSKPKNSDSNTEALDPVQIEALRSLGLSDEEIFKELGTVETEDPKPLEKVPAAQIQKKESLRETIRVDVDTLDHLVNLAGELVLVRNQLLELSKHNASEIFNSSFSNLDFVTGDIQRSLMSTRMQSISSVWNKLPRVVRDLAAQLNKKVEIVMEGESTELDRSILEAISDPMTHIIRNCVDHGIENPEERIAKGKSETGLIKLKAEHRGNWIHVEIIDDGKGMSLEVLKRKALEKSLYTESELENMDKQSILNIIFHAGFSTKEQVSNISGRGVGMDVIRSNIAKINGNVEINSEEDKGTHLKLKLPLTLAIIPAVIVSISGHRYVIPQNTVQEVAYLGKEEINSLDNIEGQRFTRLRGQILPLIFADEILGIKKQKNLLEEKISEMNYVVINADGYSYGLVIDKVLDIIEIVVKPLDSEDPNFKNYAGATIMGDGKVALILDVNSIAEKAKIEKSQNEDNNHLATKHSNNHLNWNTTSLSLIFKLRDGKNYIIPLNKTSRIEEINKSDIEERSTGTFAKLNGEIIRIIDLANLLGLSENESFTAKIKQKDESKSSLKTLYFEFNGQGIALEVGYEHNLWQRELQIKESRGSEFITGTTIINDSIYEVISIDDYLGQLVDSNCKESLIEENKKIEQDFNQPKLDETKNIISFEIGNLLFGIGLDSIKEIISSEELTPTPGSDKSVQGLLNLRGEIIVSKSLRNILDLKETSEKELKAKDKKTKKKQNRSIILNIQGEKICLQIGTVDEILSVKDSNFSSAPNNIPENILKYIKGVFKLENSMLLLLNENKLIEKSTCLDSALK
jgi:two-component system, chemotaxis family, sensor kinase CheA